MRRQLQQQALPAAQLAYDRRKNLRQSGGQRRITEQSRQPSACALRTAGLQVLHPLHEQRIVQSKNRRLQSLGQGHIVARRHQRIDQCQQVLHHRNFMQFCFFRKLRGYAQGVQFLLEQGQALAFARQHHHISRFHRAHACRASTP